jgi:hypothetical protein
MYLLPGKRESVTLVLVTRTSAGGNPGSERAGVTAVATTISEPTAQVKPRPPGRAPCTGSAWPRASGETITVAATFRCYDG